MRDGAEHSSYRAHAARIAVGAVQRTAKEHSMNHVGMLHGAQYCGEGALNQPGGDEVGLETREALQALCRRPYLCIAYAAHGLLLAPCVFCCTSQSA